MPASELSVKEIRLLINDPSEVEAEIESLLITMASQDEEVCAWASDALHGVGYVPEEIADVISDYCLHDVAPVASWACKLIAKLGTQAKMYQNAVAEALATHPSVAVRQQAAVALGKIPGLTIETFEKLEVAAASEDPRLSRLASVVVDRRRGEAA